MQTLNMNLPFFGRTVLVLTLLAVVASAAGGSGNYLIVTASEYNGSAPLNQFIAAKTAQGFNVMTYVAVSGTSRDTIKAYIDSLWGTADEPAYILLVGDAASSGATTTTLPYFTGGGSKHAPTDLTYGCMDGSGDWHPEIPVGRFPVTSVNMLQIVVDKTLFVEAGNFPDPDYILRGAFLANASTQGMAEPTHDWVIENLFEPNNYVGIKLYARDGADTQDVIDTVDAGCLWVVYYGHSSSSGWWDPSFYQDDVQALSNQGLYGVATSHSCNVGNFTMSGECLGETWIREANKGAAVVIFPSTYIYWGSQSAWEPSTVLEHAWFKAFFWDSIWEVGPAWHAALYRFEAEYTGDTDIERNFFEEFNLLGDPSLRLPDTASPLSVSPVDGLVSGGPPGGPFVPGSIVYTLRNRADYPIRYEVTHGSAAWVTLFGALQGDLLPDGSAQVTVAINKHANELPLGDYADTVHFVNLTDHVGDTTRDVLLTVGAPALQYEWTFDTNPGWSTQGLWAFGQPSGGGGEHGGPDPTAGYSGSYVYGYNLNGDYENSLPERHLTSDSVDCTYLHDVTLRFWRWLGVEQPSYDHAYVRVSNDGNNWETVWHNASTISDTSWQLQELDISDVADGEPTVYLRWTMGTTDGSWQYCGWNIDDVEVWAIHAIPGDLDGNGCVDQADLGILLVAYGVDGGGDIDGDSDTDQFDLGILLANWGEGCG